MEKHNQRLLDSTLGVLIITVISKCIGFIREMVIASQYGAGLERDAYIAAYTIPMMLSYILVSSITTTFMPAYSASLVEDGKKGANALANTTQNVMFIASVALSVLAMFFVPQIIGFIAPAMSAEGQALAVKLGYFLIPVFIFEVMISFFSFLLNAHGKFMVPQAVSFLLNICIISSIVIFAPSVGIYALIWGVLAGMLAQTVVLGIYSGRFYTYRPYIDLNNKHFKDIVHRLLPALMSVMVLEINAIIDRMLASGLGVGAMSVIEYSSKLLQFVTGTVIIAVTTVVYPRLSRQCAEKKIGELRNTTSRYISLMWGILLPIAIIAMLSSSDIVQVAFERGAFDAAATRSTSLALFYYLPGLVFIGIREVLKRVFFSLGDTKTTMYDGIINVAADSGLSIALAPYLGVGGLALGSSIAMALSCVHLFFRLRKRIGGLGGRVILIEAGKSVLAVAASAAAVLIIKGAIDGSSNTIALMRFAACAIGGFSVYALVMYICRSRLMLRATELIKEKLGRGKNRG
ncbi:MAG: murein biosynthesis integral membrane protein MurJ [Christensenellales bacterium]|jgi:putative peptidoglycan lipid II flippase